MHERCTALCDRARVFAAFPDELVEAAVLLSAVIDRAHLDGGVLTAPLPAWIVDRLAAWGAAIEDLEVEHG